MSYSFNVIAASKSEAVAKVGEEFDKVVSGQPIHAKDREAAVTAAENIIGVLEEDSSRDVSVSVNGYVSWTEGERITQASVQVSAQLVGR